MKISKLANKLNTTKSKAFARKIVADMSKPAALAPVILLEAAVTGGRTYHAYERGGFIEGRERFTEETLGALFWFGGVKLFNRMGNSVGAKVFKLDREKMAFDSAKDAIRNPFKNFFNLNKVKKLKITEKNIAAFKFTKILTSVLLANAFVGFIVPKLNQKITRDYQKSINNKENDKQTQNINSKENNIDNFIKTVKEEKSKDIQFKGMTERLLKITNGFETNSNYQLLSTDVGVAGGRAISARNKYERREALFRDLGSIYFYLYAKNHVASLLNIAQDGKANRLDAVSEKFLNNKIMPLVKNGSITAENFEEKVFGNKNAKIPEGVTENGKVELKKLKGVLSDSQYKIAEKMAELQPPIEGKYILSELQLKGVLKGGIANDPELLKNIYEAYDKDAFDILKFKSKDTFENINKRMAEYLESIIDKAKSTGENISEDILKKASRQNFAKNAFNLGAGFAICGYFLSSAIPKMQYWITKTTTGKDKFPGVEKYEDA